MFEGSLIESQVTSLSATKRWTMAGSSALQIAIAATLIAVPLLHPERLTFHVETPLVFTQPPKPPVPVRIQASAGSSPSSAIPMPEFSHRPVIPNQPAPISDPAPDFNPIHMDTGNGIPAAIASGTGHSLVVGVARVQPTKPLKVSTGVSAGMLLSPITPIYPSIAKAAGVSGTVIVEATISRTGNIESLSVMSGPPLLREAALNAIRAARYRPYLLNGEPTEIQTTFTVNFRIGG